MLLATPPGGPISTQIGGPPVQLNTVLEIDQKDPAENNCTFHLTVDSQYDPGTHPPLDVHGPLSSLIFSARFVELLKKENVNGIDFFPVEVTYAPNSKKYSYMLANIKAVKDALDESKSDYVFDKEKIIRIDNLVIDEKKAGATKLFRLREDPNIIVVHKSLKFAFEASDYDGVEFVHDSEYVPGM